VLLLLLLLIFQRRFTFTRLMLILLLQGYSTSTARCMTPCAATTTAICSVAGLPQGVYLDVA
jgi:hypothetical protein